MTKEVRLADVRRFWQVHPVAAAVNPHPLGSTEYFAYYDRLREANEPVGFSERLHDTAISKAYAYLMLAVATAMS